MYIYVSGDHVYDLNADTVPDQLKTNTHGLRMYISGARVLSHQKYTSEIHAYTCMLRVDAFTCAPGNVRFPNQIQKFDKLFIDKNKRSCLRVSLASDTRRLESFF